MGSAWNDGGSPMIDYVTAKELAQRVADSQADHLDPHESYVIVDDLAHEYPWGWIFEPAMEPYRSTGHLCPYGGAWCISVDRLSGETETSSWSGYCAGNWPVVELLLTAVGNDSTAVYRFLRNYTGWTATKIRSSMATLPVVVAMGPNTSMQPAADALVERGATVEIRQKHA